MFQKILLMFRYEWLDICTDERERQTFIVSFINVLAYFSIAMYSLKFR